LRLQWGAPEKALQQKEFDEKRETLHNLISSLLTNTTLCRQAAGRSEQVL
jgi:hypothetical protein